MNRKLAVLCIFLTVALVAVHPAGAEGSDDHGGAHQMLQSNTVMFVDILDAASESIEWIGMGNLDVTDPNGLFLGSFPSGSLISPTSGVNGAYRLTLEQDQTSAGWDLTVFGAPGNADGRLHSMEWHFDAMGFGYSESSTTSFYVLVPGSSGESTEVVEAKCEGLAGYIYRIFASDAGIAGHGGMSLPLAGHVAEPLYPVYLNDPDVASHGSATPSVAGYGFTPSFSGNSGVFEFATDVEGIYHITCDLDQDGVSNPTHPGDRLLLGRAGSGSNRVLWDARDRMGNAVPPGLYDCDLTVAVAEVHFVSDDIETSYPGIRMFHVGSDGSSAPLSMFWNDTMVMAGAVPMPNFLYGLEHTGQSGIDSGSYGDFTEPNVNARAWGDFSGAGRGNDSLLDTFAWVNEGVEGTIEITVQDRLLEVVGLVAGATEFTWDALAEASAYDVVLGDLSTLRSTLGDYASAVSSCAAENTAGTVTSHASVPVASGQGVWWLVRGVGGGGNGTYDALAFRQGAPRDTEIADSAAACE